MCAIGGCSTRTYVLRIIQCRDGDFPCLPGKKSSKYQQQAINDVEGTNPVGLTP